MRFLRSPIAALLALSVLASPVPISLASARTRGSEHRAHHKRHRKDRPQAARHSTAATRSHKRTLVFRVTGTAWHRRQHSHRIAHLAGDPADTISDFKFSPASITVHVGDTITWTNNGPTEHSATADNGSFDTGLLKKGQSASHTFNQAGTFAYICKIHPFMHGTIVVVGNSSSGSSGSTGGSTGSGSSSGSSGSSTGSSGSTGSTAAASSASSASTLPNTGLNVGGTLGAALLLLGAGAALSRRARAQR